MRFTLGLYVAMGEAAKRIMEESTAELRATGEEYLSPELAELLIEVRSNYVFVGDDAPVYREVFVRGIGLSESAADAMIEAGMTPDLLSLWDPAYLADLPQLSEADEEAVKRFWAGLKTEEVSGVE